MTNRNVRSAALALLAPLALGVVLLGNPMPAAAAPAAQSTPVDKDECKGGGWRDWEFLAPFFKNQGDCVGFVNNLPDSGVDPAATPELGSLVLFGGGAAGFAGYAWTRVRAGRGGKRDGAPGATGAAPAA